VPTESLARRCWRIETADSPTPCKLRNRLYLGNRSAPNPLAQTLASPAITCPITVAVTGASKIHPENARSPQISRCRRRAQNRQLVGSSRTQPRPRLQNTRVSQSRHQIHRRLPQFRDRLRHVSLSNPAPPMLPRSSCVRRCAESDKRPGQPMVRTTCRTISFSGMSTHSICPLTGRVGNECGEICPAQAPAQFTTTPAANCVLLVRTPHTLPSATSTASTSSPDENSTAMRAAAMAAAVRCRGSTQRSFTKKPAESFARNAGSNSSSGLGRAEPGRAPSSY